MFYYFFQQKQSNEMKKLLYIASFLCLIISQKAIASTQHISIGTGVITGVYYPAGGSICRLLHINKSEHNIRCSPESTGGSVSNLNAIRNNSIDFGIVQSDWQYNAVNGLGLFSDQKPFEELRSVLSLYTETFTVAVLKDSKINVIDDIIGKKVNFGPLGSGMHATMEVLMNVKGWTKENFSSVTYLQPSDLPQALCDRKIDVMIYAAGNPNALLQEITQSCKVKIISIDKETIVKLLKVNPFYVESIIPGGTYVNNPDPIETFGVKATLVTSKNTSEKIVYNLTKAVFENFDNFKTLHPVLSSLKKQEMIYEGNSAPMHLGAFKYFKEAKLIK